MPFLEALQWLLGPLLAPRLLARADRLVTVRISVSNCASITKPAKTPMHAHKF
ncbi:MULTISPECIES: hypothetical protein [Rhodococcus]|uniref:hypothetical protein n=1 Tax=Rhodococcus TaxID=1827 RepID=UPI0023E2D4EA|nr:hypothetical protein [Rhodococcus sp. T2V]